MDNKYWVLIGVWYNIVLLTSEIDILLIFTLLIVSGLSTEKQMCDGKRMGLCFYNMETIPKPEQSDEKERVLNGEVSQKDDPKKEVQAPPHPCDKQFSGISKKSISLKDIKQKLKTNGKVQKCAEYLKLKGVKIISAHDSDYGEWNYYDDYNYDVYNGHYYVNDGYSASDSFLVNGPDQSALISVLSVLFISSLCCLIICAMGTFIGYGISKMMRKHDSSTVRDCV